MVLYHITKFKYLDSILLEGLKINSGKIGFCPFACHKQYKKLYKGIQPIFLSDNPKYIISHMLGNKWLKKHKAVLLYIDIDLSNETYSKYYLGSLNGIDASEIIISHDISHEKITKFKKL